MGISSLSICPAQLQPTRLHVATKHEARRTKQCQKPRTRRPLTHWQWSSPPPVLYVNLLRRLALFPPVSVPIVAKRYHPLSHCIDGLPTALSDGRPPPPTVTAPDASYCTATVGTVAPSAHCTGTRYSLPLTRYFDLLDPRARILAPPLACPPNSSIRLNATTLRHDDT